VWCPRGVDARRKASFLKQGGAGGGGGGGGGGGAGSKRARLGGGVKDEDGDEGAASGRPVDKRSRKSI
jgi:hypothetical protein